jgi:tetratricopeptide (TPR) repeat protein
MRVVEKHPSGLGTEILSGAAGLEPATFSSASGRTRAHLWLGVAQIRNEAWEPAIDELEQALSIARQSQQSLAHEAQMIAYLAEAYLGGGEDRRARELAMEAVALARGQGARPNECQAQITLARALSKSENTDRTEDVKAALDRARELAEDMGARPFEAQIHEVSAELAALLGDDAGREPELREAHRLYTEMGATGHAERVARELEH